MPAQRPRASFEPLPPDFDVRTIVENTENFQYVDRISCQTIADQGLEQFEKLVLLHVVIAGKPLVIDGFEDLLDPWTFTPKWLRDNHGDKIENARDLTKRENIPLTIGHYLSGMRKLTEQFFEKQGNYREKQRQRVYLKDVDCPSVWQDKVKEQMPSGLFYLNDSTGDMGGPGAVDEAIPNATGRRKGRGIAPAGDLMSSLPPEMRAENLMCYIGHEGTYTPSHREMCASLGQNIMVEASSAVGEDGKPERPGSSIWFMTESKDRHMVSEYWLSILGHDIEVENHFAQIIAWQQAPFKTYVVEQKAGDFILIPPLAPHQVWNRGTRTMKVAWNRTTVETLELAFKEALPNARLVCRDEQYKNKAIVYYTLVKYSALLKIARTQSARDPHMAYALQISKKVRQVQKDFKRLFELYKQILLSEMFDPDKPKEHSEFIPFDSNVTCSYCRGNIFNRFLTCKTCMDVVTPGTDEPYDVCMDCFAMGRSCACQSKFTWVEQFKWKDLVHRYDEWRQQIMEFEAGASSHMSLGEEKTICPKRALAIICQEELAARPWIDVRSPHPPSDQEEESEDEIRMNDDGTVKKIKKKRSKKWLNSNMTCHVCLHRHPKWTMAVCTMCERGWCYGSLWRAHDLNPVHIMEDPSWECPHCRRVCSTGACRKDPRQRPYEPKGTLLGHDTKKVADVRSVEALVDFGKSNLNWLREGSDAPLESNQLRRRMEEAERAKMNDATLDDRYADDDNMYAVNGGSHQIAYSPAEESTPIDPRLGGTQAPSWRVGENGLVDPSLQEHPHNHPNEDVTMVDASVHDPAGNGFDNGEGSGFVAPSAVMYNDPETNDNYAYPNSRQDRSASLKPTGSKRKRPNDEQIRLVEPKKRKTGRKKKKKKRKSGDAEGEDEEEEPQPVQNHKNKATKQYQQEQERKQLEEAKRAGRLIQVLGAMKGRNKIVTLRVDKEKLAAIAASSQARRPPHARSALDGSNDNSKENGVLLQSDLRQPAAPVPLSQMKPKKAQVHKIRVEDDGDFRTRERRSTMITGGAPKPARKAKKQYEEIEIDSEGDDGIEEFATQTNNEPGGSNRRRSNWLARKNQDDPDAPEELPENFKDGQVSRHNRRRPLKDGSNRRTTLPAKQVAMKAPRIRPIRASTGNMLDLTQEDDQDGAFSEEDVVESAQPDDIPGSAWTTVQSVRDSVAKPVAPPTPKPVEDTAAIALAQSAAAMLEEDNLNAKLAAAKWAEGDDDVDDFLQQGDAVPEPEEETLEEPEGIAPEPIVAVGTSIFSRPGEAGKKIKIVSATTVKKKDSLPNGLASAKVAPTKSAYMHTSDEESSDGENEIPARAPPPAKTKSVKGMPMPIPAQSSPAVPAKRGRDRPRKSVG